MYRSVARFQRSWKSTPTRSRTRACISAFASWSQSTSVSHRSKITARIAQHLPRAADVVLRRPRVADREPDHVSPRSFVVATKISPVAVARARDLVVVGLDVPEADGRERVRRDDLPAGLGLDQLREERREPDVLADQRPQALRAVPAQHGPELQRAEPAAERRPVVLEVTTASGRGEVVGPSENASWNASGRRVQSVEQSIGVKSHLCGLTTIESARVDAVEAPAELGADRRRARVRGVDVQPDACLVAAARELAHGIDRRRGGRADGRDDRGRIVEREVGEHPELVVDRRLAVLEPEEPRRLLDAKFACSDATTTPPGLTRARRGERGDRRGRRRVLDVPVPAARQAEQLREPVDHRDLELGRGRRRRATSSRSRSAPRSAARRGSPAPSRCSRSTRRSAGGSSA